MLAHILLLQISLLTLQAIAQTVIDVPLAQGTTQQQCTQVYTPGLSSVSVDKCRDDLSDSGFTLQCCNSAQQASQSPTSNILGLLGVTVNPSNALVGNQCTPISNPASYQWPFSCSNQLLCCQNNDYNGLVAIGCFPVTQY